jgi:hypothetical protein
VEANSGIALIATNGWMQKRKKAKSKRHIMHNSNSESDKDRDLLRNAERIDDTDKTNRYHEPVNMIGISAH